MSSWYYILACGLQALALFPAVYWLLWIADAYLKRGIVTNTLARLLDRTAMLSEDQVSSLLGKYGPMRWWVTALWAVAICAGFGFLRWVYGEFPAPSNCR